MSGRREDPRGDPGTPPARPLFSSRIGVVLTFIGVAVGLGNVWRFPYMVAAFGGGAFLIVYLAILLAFGIPALLAELALGRLARRGPMGAFTHIGMPQGKVVGWVLLVTVLMAVSYYTVIVGWVLRYFVLSVFGGIARVDPQRYFDDVLGGVGGQLLATAVVLALVAFVLLLGIRKGAERLSTFGMPALFLILIVLLVRSLTLPGAAAGLRYYLIPDFTKITPGVLAAALGQVFFSLSLGGTYMLTYASYLPATVNLRRAAIVVGLGETLAAVLAGLVIVPAAVAFGLQMNSGPPLTFITAPSIFAAMPSGSIFAVLFFGLLFFAAFLSDVAAFEVLVAGMVDQYRWARAPTILFFGAAALLLGIVPMLSLEYILTSDLLWGSIMQPVGSALALLGLIWIVGRGRALAEVNRGIDGPPVGAFWILWIQYVIPIGIGVILVLGVADLFGRFVG